MRLTMLVLFLSLAAFGQQPPEGPPPGGPPPGKRMPMPEPKNLKLLKPEHLMETMQSFRVALGVRCDFCHVQNDFASDEKPHKEIARKMIGVEIEVTDTAHHFIMWDDPNWMFAHLDRFLTGKEPNPTR